MKKIVILMFVIFSLSAFAERYRGGYINGLWYPFYKGTWHEKECIRDRREDEPEQGNCTDMGYISFTGTVSIIGIAEPTNQSKDYTKLIIKLSDFAIADDEKEKNVYTPYDYPAEKKDKNGKYFPLVLTLKNNFMEDLKKKNIKLKYTGKTWEEEYYVDKKNSEYIRVDHMKHLHPRFKKYGYTRKKIKFLGVEEIKLDVYLTASYYNTIAQNLCIDFERNVETC